LIEGRIVLGLGGLYTVRDAGGTEYVLRAKGKFRRMKLTPLVGDNVLFSPGAGDEHGWVEEILPRISVSIRPPAANIQLLIVVVAPSPAPDLLLVDRLLVGARQQHMDALLVLNKRELDPQLTQQLAKEYEKADISYLPVSAAQSEGLEHIREKMHGKLCCLAGQSGVGKSTILNTLFGLSLKTGEISQRIERGRQTTRHAELLEMDGLEVLDTPGFSLWEMAEPMDPVHLQEYYPEFIPYQNQCKFSPCYHYSEPGCQVLAAVNRGELNRERIARYHALLNLWKQSWRERYD
jgi:ribosome biogenesis GTPase / thiamine phosphate phosphatase